MKPVLQALLVADHVYKDAVTGKMIIAGVFHRLLFYKDAQPSSPAETAAPQPAGVIQIAPGGHRVGSPFCYISLTEVHKNQQFELRYVDLAEDKALFGTQFTLSSEDPLQTVEIALPLPSLPTLKAGTFAIELLWQNEQLGSHRINVDEAKAGA